jgi:hypothetical protein
MSRNGLHYPLGQVAVRIDEHHSAQDVLRCERLEERRLACPRLSDHV